MILAAIPIKPFGVAKARLSPVLGPVERSRLGRAVAAHTAARAAEAGAEVVVVTSDEGVASWAKEHDLVVVREDPRLGPGLNGAARTAAKHAAQLGMRWVVVHADLPIATTEVLRAAFALAIEGDVIAASYDGGTNLIGGADEHFPFSYGKGSFHHHLAAMPAATVMTSSGLALDLDTPLDLARARASPGGRWLERVLRDAET